MNEQLLNLLWMETVRGAQVNVDEERLLKALRGRSGALARSMGIADLAERVGGVIFAVLAAYVVWQDPGLTDGLGPGGLVGLAMFLGAVIGYHYLSSRSRRSTAPEAPTLKSMLEFDLSRVEARITLFRLIARVLLPLGIAGLFLVLLSFSGGLVETAIGGAVLAIQALGMLLLIRRSVVRHQEPLRSEMTDRLSELLG